LRLNQIAVVGYRSGFVVIEWIGESSTLRPLHPSPVADVVVKKGYP
jgi:hypothetical protein